MLLNYRDTNYLKETKITEYLETLKTRKIIDSYTYVGCDINSLPDISNSKILPLS